MTHVPPAPLLFFGGMLRRVIVLLGAFVRRRRRANRGGGGGALFKQRQQTKNNKRTADRVRGHEAKGQLDDGDLGAWCVCFSTCLGVFCVCVFGAQLSALLLSADANDVRAARLASWPCDPAQSR
jgi:hypothetical protein